MRLEDVQKAPLPRVRGRGKISVVLVFIIFRGKLLFIAEKLNKIKKIKDKQNN